MRRPIAIALIALLPALLTGCGGGAAAVGWGAEADAICRTDEAATAALTRRLEGLARAGFRTPGERAAAAAIIHRGVTRLSGKIPALRRLPPPAQKAATAAALIDRLAEKLVIDEGLARAFESGSGPRIERVLGKLLRNEERGERLARRLGLSVCGIP